MNRYFFTAEQQEHDIVWLADADAHHILHVMRNVPGDLLELCDGKGRCYHAVITSVHNKGVTCLLKEQLPDREPSVRFTLAFSLLKGEKVEWILQKATELGVSGFMPFISERSVVRLEEKKARERLKRWEKITLAASCQSKRGVIPYIMPPCNWQQLVGRFADFHKVLFFFFEGTGGCPLSTVLRETVPDSPILLITGPEGGFSPDEAATARSHGAETVTLGPRILRAETAALTAAALVLYQVGELGGKT
jgi:16S rRNA (uracil1498-N3)-methyltransferase